MWTTKRTAERLTTLDDGDRVALSYPFVCC